MVNNGIILGELAAYNLNRLLVYSFPKYSVEAVDKRNVKEDSNGITVLVGKVRLKAWDFFYSKKDSKSRQVLEKFRYSGNWLSTYQENIISKQPQFLLDRGNFNFFYVGVWVGVF